LSSYLDESDSIWARFGFQELMADFTIDPSALEEVFGDLSQETGLELDVTIKPTSAEDLRPLVESMSTLVDEAGQMDVPVCATDAHNAMTEYMMVTRDAFGGLLDGVVDEPDAENFLKRIDLRRTYEEAREPLESEASQD
jgi:hypothetical protein